MSVAENILSIVASLLTIWLTVGTYRKGSKEDARSDEDAMPRLQFRHYALGTMLAIAMFANVLASVGGAEELYAVVVGASLFAGIGAVASMLNVAILDGDQDWPFYFGVILIAAIFMMLSYYSELQLLPNST